MAENEVFEDDIPPQPDLWDEFENNDQPEDYPFLDETAGQQSGPGPANPGSVEGMRAQLGAFLYVHFIEVDVGEVFPQTNMFFTHTPNWQPEAANQKLLETRTYKLRKYELFD
jgi:hypothetical protein